MFGFLKKKEQKVQKIVDPLNLRDEDLAELIFKTFETNNTVTAAMFLVAYENFTVYYSVFLSTVNVSKEFEASLAGMAAFLYESRQKYSGTSIDDEYTSRRLFYLYLVTLLKSLHARAKTKPELWDMVVPIWCQLLPGARALRETLDRTKLWTDEEVKYFESVKTESEGENYCLSLMVPAEIRYHRKIQDWLERDLSPEDKERMREIDKMLAGQ